MFLFVWGLWAGIAKADPLDLATCIRIATAHYPGVQAASVDVGIAQTQLAQARAARFLPKFELTSVLGPSPEARGNALVGTSDLSNLSVFTHTEASFVQPLYTFGKLSGAQDAAADGVRAYEAGLQKSREDLALQVAQVYYGLQLANDLWDLAQEAQSDYQSARDYVAEKLDADEGNFTYTDLARIDRFAYDVTEKVNAARKAKALAESGMRALLGLSETDSLVLAGTLTVVPDSIQSLSTYLDHLNQRPDVQQLDAAVAARKSLVRVAKSDLYPQVFIAGEFKYGYAPNRDEQDSPFAKDDFNFKSLGAVVGIKQTLSFGLTSASAKKARLEHEKLVYQDDLAHKGAAIEIEKIYRDLIEAKSNVEAAEKARKATRRWFISVRDGFNAGLEKSSDMIEVVKEYGIIRAKYFQDVFNYNQAWAKLQRATGQPIVQ